MTKKMTNVICSNNVRAAPELTGNRMVIPISVKSRAGLKFDICDVSRHFETVSELTGGASFVTHLVL